MKRMLFAAICGALMLAGCGQLGVNDTPPAPAATPAAGPLASTTIDERGINFAFESADVIRAMVAQLRVSGHPLFQPGTASARRVGDALDTLATVLQAASVAQKAGNNGLADIKLGEATNLMAEIRAIIAGGN
jgi:hypothetical protein